MKRNNHTRKITRLVKCPLIALVLAWSVTAHGLTLEEVADLRGLMNQQLKLKGTIDELTRGRAVFTELLFMDKNKGWTSEVGKTAHTEDGGLHWKDEP